LGANQTDLKLGDKPSNEIRHFVDTYGDDFLDFILNVSWSHDSRDSSLFPTRGGTQSLRAGVAIPGSDLTYYRTEYRNRHYFPLNDFFTLSLNGEVGYGDGYGDVESLPFFQNFFAGGIRSVRGYQNRSLGPRDSKDDALGGNLKTVANAELLFPAPFGIADKTVRLGAFFDAGNVFDTDQGDGFDSGELRYSTGLSMTWMSPIGILGVVLAQPLNEKDRDETENFQFTFGQAF
jgi:outer membrane protein insertion porin family